MMIRTGHRPEDWRDLGPAYGGSVRLGGALVVGGKPRPATGAGLTANQNQPHDLPRRLGRPPRPIAGLTEEQAEARRASWRETKRRKRQASERAQLRADVAAIRAERVG